MPIKIWSRHEWPPQFPYDVWCMPNPSNGIRPPSSVVESEPTDCILVVGVSRPRIAVIFLAVALLSLFLTFHILYDSAVYSLRVASSSSTESVTMNEHSSDVVISHPNKMHFPKTSRQLPQAIIIGVRKCGTRALLEMLFLHPQIQKAAGEVHFFDRDENYFKGLEWYRKRMPYSFKGQITIEKSPSYFITPEVPERIFAMNSSVRILLIVREPVTRAISDYAQLRSHASIGLSSPSLTSQTITSNKVNYQRNNSVISGNKLPPQATKSFEELSLLPDGSINVAYRPISISVYHLYMLRWIEVFQRDQILIVNGDKLIEDPLPQLRRIESFLGLDSRIGRHNLYFNRTKGFYCMRNDTSEKCLRESKGRRHPKVDPNVVKKLRQFFNEHNKRFYDLVGENFGWPDE